MSSLPFPPRLTGIGAVGCWESVELYLLKEAMGQALARLSPPTGKASDVFDCTE